MNQECLKNCQGCHFVDEREGGNEIHGNGSATTNGNDSRIGTAYHMNKNRLLDSVTCPVNVWHYALIPCGQTEFWLVFRPGSGQLTKSRSVQV